MKVAVVGAGIAGLGAAWALSQRHDVTIFEADDRPGGHAHTVEVDAPGGPIPVDTGFIVYNEPTYPHLTRLFEHLGVDTMPSDMSFAFSRPGLEYAGSVRGLLANPGQLLAKSYRGMIADIARFRRTGIDLLSVPMSVSLGEALAVGQFGPSFRNDYLVPMAAAIWSARRAEILDYPARAFLQFFRNHGLIRITDRPPWRTVVGGSRTYVDRLAAGFGRRLRVSQPVRSVDRLMNAVLVRTSAHTEAFDHVVLATHTDQSLAVLGDHASDQEIEILKSVRYEDNLAVLHSDPALMPRNRAIWSSWNYMSSGPHVATERASVTYWMNRLQNIDTRDPLFVSLNPSTELNPDLVHATFTYAHPQFDAAALDAQRRLASIQGASRTWFAGAWCGYGFHEDGLQSGFNVAAALGSPAPWHDEVVPMSSAPAPDRAVPVGAH